MAGPRSGWLKGSARAACVPGGIAGLGNACRWRWSGRVKDEAQQARLPVHRVRQGFVEQRTVTLNRIRGLLSEFGIVMPLKATTVRRQAALALEDLPGEANLVVGDLLSELHHLDQRIADYDRRIVVMAREDDRARRLMRCVVSDETTASAIVAEVGNGHDFTCGRQFAAWLGLVPGQYSSGCKPRLGRITKAGNPYLRTLLILGARAVLAAAPGKSDRVSRWAVSVQQRRGYWKATIAIAAKNARMAWAILSKGEAFRMPA